MLTLLFAAPRWLRDGLLIVAACAALIGLANAQQLPASARFAQEWSALDSSINAASLQRQHVVDAAKALVEENKKQAKELDYWHKWIAGEKAKWTAPLVAKPGEVKP